MRYIRIIGYSSLPISLYELTSNFNSAILSQVWWFHILDDGNFTTYVELVDI